MNRLLGICLAAAWPALGLAAETETFNGLTNCLVLRGGDNRAVISPAVGARLLSYSINGENIIYENIESWGRTLLNSTNHFWAGGYQLDLGPEMRGIPAHPWLWQGPWPTRAVNAFTVQATSEPDRTLGVQLEKEFTMDPDSGELGLVQKMRNVTANDVTFCLWDRTLCKGGGYALLPLAKKSRFKAGWAIRRGEAGKYAYDGDSPKDARAKVMEGVLVVEGRALPGLESLKVGTDAEAGWIAYVRGKVLLVKFFPVTAGANYSDGGNTTEFYCDKRVSELEPLSPEVTLKQGENYSFPGKWLLMELPEEITSAKMARALVKRIPRSPFAR